MCKYPCNPCKCAGANAWQACPCLRVPLGRPCSVQAITRACPFFAQGAAGRDPRLPLSCTDERTLDMRSDCAAGGRPLERPGGRRGGCASRPEVISIKGIDRTASACRAGRQGLAARHCALQAAAHLCAMYMLLNKIIVWHWKSWVRLPRAAGTEGGPEGDQEELIMALL